MPKHDAAESPRAPIVLSRSNMWSGASHPYTLQLAALWISFIPAFAIVALLFGAYVERAGRGQKKVRVAIRTMNTRAELRNS